MSDESGRLGSPPTKLLWTAEVVAGWPNVKAVNAPTATMASSTLTRDSNLFLHVDSPLSYFTVKVMSCDAINPPSCASVRSTYRPGSEKVTSAVQRLFAGIGGTSQPADQGELRASR